MRPVSAPRLAAALVESVQRRSAARPASQPGRPLGLRRQGKEARRVRRLRAVRPEACRGHLRPDRQGAGLHRGHRDLHGLRDPRGAYLLPAVRLVLQLEA